MLCAKFSYNGPSGSGKKIFLNSVNVFALFRHYLHLEKGVALHVNKFSSPSHKDALCPSSPKDAL